MPTVEQNTLDVLNSKLLHKRRREDTTRKRTSENGRKLLVQTTDSQILKLEIWLNNSGGRPSFCRSFELNSRVRGPGKLNLGLLHDDAAGNGFHGRVFAGLAAAERAFDARNVQSLHCCDGNDEIGSVEVKAQGLSRKKAV